MAVQPTRLCIISREPLRGEHFAAALKASLDPEDDLKIIIDRRRGESSGEPDPKEDRRRHQVALALEANGFAIVPASVDQTENKTVPSLPSLLSFEMPIERVPTAHVAAVDDETVDDEDEERLESTVDDEDEEPLESIPSSRRWQPGTLIPKLFGVLIGVTLAAVVLSLVGQLAGQSLVSQVFTGPLSGGPDRPPGQPNDRVAVKQFPAPTQEPVVAETPPPARPNSGSSLAGAAARPRSDSPRDADRLTPKPREASSPPEATGTASRAPNITPKDNGSPPEEGGATTRGAGASVKETGTPPQAGTGTGARGGARPEPGDAARPSPSAPPRSNEATGALPPRAVTAKAPSTEAAGSHRAQLVGAPISRRSGDSYAVRLLDAADRPMVDANVVLVARMADGTVENIAMGALSEPGTYRGTVPTNRSTLVDLRVRVATGGGFVEVPVSR